jgi:hypothetical protein
MMFQIPLPDGKRLCVQFVVRKKYNRYGEELKTVYLRGCADTFYHPTPSQQKVRDTLSYGASRAYNHPIEHLEASVQDAFRNWVKMERKNKAAIEDYLMEAFPDDTEAVIKYLEAI